MNKEERIIDYLNGNLTEAEQKQFESDLVNDSKLKLEFDEYKLFFGDVDNIPMELPSEHLKSNFEKMLAEELKKEEEQAKVIKFEPRKYLKSISAVAAILVIGILVGINYNQSQQLDRMDSQAALILNKMTSDLNSNSVTGRINAMQVGHDLKNPQIEIINTLIKTLKEDESPNVRLAAAEALESHVDQTSVRVAMVERLSNEKDPFVLIALIGTLSNSKDQSAKESLIELTTTENIEQFIKDEAHLGLIQLEKI